jgi:hypothetical protein
MYYKVDLLLKHNKIPTEELKREEEERIKKEPIGDHQSPSDNERWTQLYKDIELKRLRYNIGISKSKEEDRNYLLENKCIINKAIQSKLQTYNEFILPKSETCLQSLYTTVTCLPNKFTILTRTRNEIKQSICELKTLLADIVVQLEIYDECIDIPEKTQV